MSDVPHEASMRRMRGVRTVIVLLGAFAATWALLWVALSDGDTADPRVKAYGDWTDALTDVRDRLYRDYESGRSAAVIIEGCADLRSIVRAGSELPATGHPKRDAAFARAIRSLTVQARICEAALVSGEVGDSPREVKYVTADPKKLERFNNEDKKIQDAIDEFNGGVMARGLPV